MLLKTKADFENIGETMSKKSFPKVNKKLIPTTSKSSLEVLGLNIKLHALPDNLPDSRPICQSDFSHTLGHGNSR